MIRAAAVVLLAGLAACGFQPLYGRTESGAVSDDLAAVKVATIANREGQQLHNFLLDRLNPHGPAEKELYALTVSLDESRQDLAIRKDETATRANLTLSARYALTEIRTGALLFEATSTATTSFNIVQSDFATYTSENDARRRATRDISDEIRERLAVYFNRRRRGGS